MSFLTRLKNEKWIVLFSSFLLPSLTAAVIFAASGVYPFGDRCILHVDMYHQYAPFFMELLHKLKSGGSMMYSWNIGLGSDFIGTFAYYLASPLNLFLAFIKRESLIEFMTVLILVKTGLSGLTMAFYCRGHFGDSSARLLFPAVFYALSGFFTAYYWDIMWLDPVFLFPLILLGMERLVKYGKCALYTITLALAVWSNYYISIMIVLFLILWYFLNLSELAKTARERAVSFCRMLLYSFLAGGCSAVLLIPEIHVLSVSGSGSNAFPESASWYFSVWDELGRHLTLAPISTTEGELPNVFCGAATLFLVVLFFLNRRISLSRKLKRIALIAFLFLGFNLNILDFIWHGFHFPEGLPAREAFLYSFLLLITAYEALLKAEGNEPGDLAAGGLLMAAILAAVGAFGAEEGRGLSIAVSAVLLGCFLLLYLFYRFGPKHLGRLITLAALTLAVFEAGVNFSESGMSTTSRSAYLENLTAIRALTTEAAAGDGAFFRTEKYERMMKDENLLSSYPAASLFSSLVNFDVTEAYKSVGMEGGGNFYCYNGATPLLSAMLSVKYLLTDSPLEDSFLRQNAAEQDGMYLYENTYVLPLGFAAPLGVEEQWKREETEDRVDAVNGLGIALGAEENTLLYQGRAEEREDGASFTAARDGYFYAVHQGKGIPSITVTAGDRETTLSKTTHNYFLDLGYLKKGETAVLTASNGKTIPAEIYRLNPEAVDQAFSHLDGAAFTPDRMTDTEVRGSAVLPADGEIIFSIPAETGWSVYVDGEKTEPERFMNAFIKLPLSKGEHEIRLSYETPGIRVGGMISIASAVLLMLLLIRGALKARVSERALRNNSPGETQY